MSISSTQSKRFYKIYIGVGILVIFLIASFLPLIPVAYEVAEPHQKTEPYWEKEPYQVTKTESNTLINGNPTVSGGKYSYYSIYIEISEKERNVVSGRVIETAGYDISFYVFDQKGFNAWRGEGSATPYVSAGKITDYNYSFVPDHSDYYCFVLDNGYSRFTNKVPQITATWNYQVTVTEYRDVQKTRTITDYVKVPKTKYVSLFQLLTGTG